MHDENLKWENIGVGFAFQMPTEEEIDMIYRTFIENYHDNDDRFIDDLPISKNHNECNQFNTALV